MTQAQDTLLVENPEYLGLIPPWMPLDAVVDWWATFAREATTAAALTATSHAFAALSPERIALHCYTLTRLEQRRPGTANSGKVVCEGCEEAMTALSSAATHWQQVAHSRQDGGTDLWTNREGVLS